MKLDITLPKILALVAFILALIGAVELGTGSAVDPRWLGYAALAALALSAAV